MTLVQIINAQNEMMRLKGKPGYEEQKKIVNEQKKKLPLVMVAVESTDEEWFLGWEITA